MRIKLKSNSKLVKGGTVKSFSDRSITTNHELQGKDKKIERSPNKMNKKGKPGHSWGEGFWEMQRKNLQDFPKGDTRRMFSNVETPKRKTKRE